MFVNPSKFGMNTMVFVWDWRSEIVVNLLAQENQIETKNKETRHGTTQVEFLQNLWIFIAIKLQLLNRIISMRKISVANALICEK